MIEPSELNAWEGSTSQSFQLWEWRSRRLIAEVRRLQARVAEIEQFNKELLTRLGFDLSPPTPEEEAWACRVMERR